MSNSFTNQVIAQVTSAPRPAASACTCCPSTWTRRSARLHLDALGVRLTELTKEQAAYIGVPVDRPFKPDHYRY